MDALQEQVQAVVVQQLKPKCILGKVAFMLLVFLFAWSHNIIAQERDYAIRLAGFQIGDLKVKKYPCDTLTCYELKSKVNFWLFTRVMVDYAVITKYYDVQLISSVVTTHSSKGDFESVTQWNKDHYRVKVNAYQYKKDTTIHDPIYFNVGKLYFEKPHDNEAIYADNYGVITRAKVVKGNEIAVSVLENDNTYLYDEDLLVRAEMYNPIKNYQVKLKSRK